MTTEKIEKKYLDVPFEVKAEDIKEDGTFEGKASLFDNQPDAHRDLVARGAFVETLAAGGRNKTGIAMLYQHRTDKIPGVWLSLQEDTKSLRVKGQLALETQLGKEVHEIMKLGIKTGMWKFSLSIGYDTQEYEMQEVKVGDTKIKVRLIKKAELWEISIVTFPAKLGATVTGVKKLIDKVDELKLKEGMEDAETVREAEDILRDSGFSKKEAQQFIAICKAALRDSKVVEKDNSGLSVILDDLKLINKDMEMTDILGSLQNIG